MNVSKLMNPIIIATGFFLIILAGGRFLFDPIGGQNAFGIPQVETNGNLSFHYIKGIRDVIVGVFFLILVYYKHYKLLGWFLLVSGVIAATDAWIVLGYNRNNVLDAWMHLSALPICILGCIYYLRKNTN
ncbi:DUF4267 domain-containing protein [Maribacter litoralis]|uniref:DUF4267 domain-containing protein n=1 Tax=Maribacter litoralis TaxID=2059726 RepID=A0A653XD82_9FLAO|nr:DUF4267 domain-containing protein [Maribacter litoralis]VXC27995.1 conserved membrane hypothetical protein [Maribacter litoralis]